MWKKKPKEPTKAESYVTFYASVSQVEQLYTLGAISWSVAEEARQAGGLKVKLPAHVYQAFIENEKIGAHLNPPNPVGESSALDYHIEGAEAAPTKNNSALDSRQSSIAASPSLGVNRQLLEELAQRIHKARMDSPARLFLTTNRPMSFVGSQMLVAAQPMMRMIFGAGGSEWMAKYSDLLEKRSNLDWLLARLEELNQ